MSIHRQHLVRILRRVLHVSGHAFFSLFSRFCLSLPLSFITASSITALRSRVIRGVFYRPISSFFASLQTFRYGSALLLLGRSVGHSGDLLLLDGYSRLGLLRPSCSLPHTPAMHSLSLRSYLLPATPNKALQRTTSACHVRCDKPTERTRSGLATLQPSLNLGR